MKYTLMLLINIQLLLINVTYKTKSQNKVYLIILMIYLKQIYVYCHNSPEMITILRFVYKICLLNILAEII